jgi:RHH-type rel operon transcriptional repressor/antitoxin RelB
MLSLQLPKEVDLKLDALTKQTGRTKTFYAIQAIVQHIDDLEDYYAGENAYNEWVAEGKKTHSMSEVFEQDV